MAEKPNFRIIEFKYAHPVTGMRFWIEWEVEEEVEHEIQVLDKSWKTLWGLFHSMKKTVEKKLEKEWKIFSDPASTETNTGYRTDIEARYVIDRYIMNLRPIIHKY